MYLNQLIGVQTRTARRSNQSILKEMSPEYSLEGLMLKLKFQYFDHLMQRTNSFGKDPDAGNDWRQAEKGMTEDEIVGWHHQLNGHEFEQAPGVSEGQGSLVCCSPWGHKESGMTEWLNHNIKLGLGFIFVFPFSYLFDPAPFIDKVVFDKFVPMPWSATFFTNQVPVYAWICF